MSLTYILTWICVFDCSMCLNGWWTHLPTNCGMSVRRPWSAYRRLWTGNIYQYICPLFTLERFHCEDWQLCVLWVPLLRSTDSVHIVYVHFASRKWKLSSDFLCCDMKTAPCFEVSPFSTSNKHCEEALNLAEARICLVELAPHSLKLMWLLILKTPLKRHVVNISILNFCILFSVINDMKQHNVYAGWMRGACPA